MEKPVAWVGRTLNDVRALPREAQRELGFDLGRVQLGGMPRDWKAVPSVGTGVFEIRVRMEGAYRLMYVATYPEAVYALHAFEKKTRKTPRRELATARARLAHVLRIREGR